VRRLIGFARDASKSDMQIRASSAVEFPHDFTEGLSVMIIGTFRTRALQVSVASLCLLLLVVETRALAGTVTVPYTGSFDEVDVPGPQDGLPAGDYDTIGGLPDVGLFNLVAGSNTFDGSVWTPGDSSDSFLLGIGPLQTLKGASIAFGTNLSPFAPMFAFPAPQWTLEESGPTPTIFNLTVGSNGLSATQITVAPAFERGEGVYSVVIGNGTFGINTGNYDTPIDYTMTFETMVVPEPSSLCLMCSLAVVGLSAGLVRRCRGKHLW
jgi:hypothetical protein